MYFAGAVIQSTHTAIAWIERIMTDEEQSRIRRIDLVIENHKSFKPSGTKIANIYPINLVIGRNNAGKSAFLDVIEYLTATTVDPRKREIGQPTVHLDIELTEGQIARAVPDNVSGGDIGGNHRAFCLKFIGQTMRFQVEADGTMRPIINELQFPGMYLDALTKAVIASRRPLLGLTTRKIAAERNMVPEQHDVVRVLSSGVGMTNAISTVLHVLSHDPASVEVGLLQELNQIMGDDAHFTRIQTRLDANTQTWEIYLDEEGKGEIALSASGSGLKTIIQVLAEMLLMPLMLNVQPQHCLFIFEELENNLHPGIQRRLLRFVRDKVLEFRAVVFIATHSSVILDMFANDVDAQILHVTQDNCISSVSEILSRPGLHGALNDLDVRASDLLQTNGVLWVEGPSDRILLRKMIELVSGGQIVEGQHYQALFYGGAILKHFTAENDNDGLIDLLLTNRNAALVMDRDTNPLGTTKVRIAEEFERHEKLLYVTQFKEIECDLPNSCLARSYPALLDESPLELEPFPVYLDRLSLEAAKDYANKKVEFALKIAETLTLDDVKNSELLFGFIQDFVTHVTSWNK
jgi:hypothetical protein